MRQRLTAHVRHNVVAWVALFVALGGTSYAAATVGSGQIADNSIRSEDVRDDTSSGGGLRSSDIRNDDTSGGGLTGRDVRRGTLTGSDVKDGSLTASDLDPSLSSSREASALASEPSTQVVVRARGAGTQTPTTNSNAPYPMTGATWTQAENELNHLLGGEITYDAPSHEACEGPPHGPGNAWGEIFLDNHHVGSFGGTTGDEARQDAKSVAQLNKQPYLFEPGTATEREVRVEVGDNCEGAHFVVKDVKVNVGGIR